MIVPSHPPRSTDGIQQDAHWAEFAADLAHVLMPFSEQWDAFQQIYARRATGDGPPLVWTPTTAYSANSNIKAALASLGAGSYADLHRLSVRSRETFWRYVLRRLAVQFVAPPTRVVNLTGDARSPTWLPGATLNIVDSCFTGDPERTAIVFAREESDDLHRLTYGELERAVNRVAAGLRRRGLAGKGVALYMPMNIECVEAYLGVIRAGGFVVSIAESFPPDEIRKRVALGNVEAVITSESYRRGGKDIPLFQNVRDAGAPPAIVVPRAGTGAFSGRAGDLPWSDLLEGDETTLGPPHGPPDRTINVLFSSGTTGTPKAIPWTQVTPLKSAMDGHFHQDIRGGDVVAWPTSVGWMMGPWLIFASLMNGATMALFEGSPALQDFVRFVERAQVSVLGVIPSLVRAWRKHNAVSPDVWRQVRLFSSTGEASNMEDYLWLMSCAAYRAPIIEYLGGTEVGGAHITGTVVQPASPATFTSPALGIEVALLNEQHQLARPGESGELFLVPPALGLSDRLLNGDHDAVYHQSCPRAPDGRLLRRHGDRIGSMAGGFLRAEGRIDDTMNLGGIKVGSRDIELVIDEYEAIDESAAVAVRPGGEGAEVLIVYATLAHSVDEAALRNELDTLLRIRLNPLFRIHELVILDSLPRTATNKVKRQQLRERFNQDASGQEPSG